MRTDPKIEISYQEVHEKYLHYGIDTNKVLTELNNVSISLNCWQGDDIGGFESSDSKLSGGGILATGNYPGKARNIEELQNDLSKAFSLIPGNHRVNLHAIYGNFGGEIVDRDEIKAKHFLIWIDWAKKENLRLLATLPFEPEVVQEGDAGDISLLDNDELPITQEFDKMVDEILKLTEGETYSMGHDRINEVSSALN